MLTKQSWFRPKVAFLAGLMYTVIGLLRLGWITQYLSQPVISGFMSGACITIAMSQVGLMLQETNANIHGDISVEM